MLFHVLACALGYLSSFFKKIAAFLVLKEFLGKKFVKNKSRGHKDFDNDFPQCEKKLLIHRRIVQDQHWTRVSQRFLLSFAYTESIMRLNTALKALNFE